MSTHDRRKALVEILKAWQALEARSVTQSAAIGDRTHNPVLRLVMDILRRDAAMHHRVQQFLIETMTRRAVALTVEDLEQVWAALETHAAEERETARLAAAARDALAGTEDVVQGYLLSWLDAGVRTHDQLLAGLELIRRGAYRAA